MRAVLVPPDTIDLLVTAAVIAVPVERCESPRALVAAADRIGLELTRDNYTSVCYDTGVYREIPGYEWRPVVELLTPATREQMLQIERCRLLYAEVSCHHESWDYSASQLLVDRLGDAIARYFAGETLVPSPEHPGVLEYDGLHRAPEEWTRVIGFRPVLTIDVA